MILHEESMKIVKETLGEDYLQFHLSSFRIEEMDGEEPSRVVATIAPSIGENFDVEGQGVGALHAFFLGMRERLSNDYPSVRALVFSSIRAKNLPNSVVEEPTDADAEVSIWAQNSNGDEFEFLTRSRSFVRAAFMAITESFEYFVNCERTYVQLLKALEYYKSEGRSELVDKYTSLMGQIVRNTSYSEVIEQIKAGEYEKN